ncbi:MAG TPA: hypothetical protein VF398_01000 [bacterium]|jgi:hypothetical protein
MRGSIISILALAFLTLAAGARDQKVMMFQESTNGDCRAELQINSDEGSIVAGCRTSSKSKDFEAYWMKSDKNGNRVCVEKSKRDDVTRGHYLQKSADGSSLIASYESTPEKSDHVHLLLKASSGDEMRVTKENEAALLKRMINLDHEINIYMKDVQKNLRRASAIHGDWDSLR